MDSSAGEAHIDWDERPEMNIALAGDVHKVNVM
jgi:hypothetical protein